jgi:hypothetical protein
MAKDAFAREHMQWTVSSELLFTVARRNLRATTSYLQEFKVVTEKINTLARVLKDDYQLDILARAALHTARARLLGDWAALVKQLWESISELYQIYMQLWGMARCMYKNATCPRPLVEQLCSATEDFRYQELEPLKKGALAVRTSLQD